MIHCCGKHLLFRDISTSKNINDPLTSFSLVNFILACFVFKYSLNYQGGKEIEIEQKYRQHIFYNTKT